MGASEMERVTFSPGEFAELFGKSQTWGYRQIYAGKVKTITEYGRILIPAAEVEKILGSASRYEGMKKKPARTKAEIQALKPELKNAWKDFVAKRRAVGKSQSVTPRAPKSARKDSGARKSALARLLGHKTKNSER
jgi:hypothetical protein